ncbi:MAG: M23 family metallopeptidase [Spirochaetales bacterium]|nr:M23 family metallopeptidase [Spirochaetales bacterium]
MLKRMSEQSISSRTFNGYGSQNIIGVDWSRKLDRKSAGPLSNPNLKSLVVFSQPEYKQNFNNAYKYAGSEKRHSERRHKEKKSKKPLFGSFHSANTATANIAAEKKQPKKQIMYKLLYGTAFLGLFGMMFFWTVRISFAANIETSDEQEYNEYVQFEEYPERHLEEIIFGDEEPVPVKTEAKQTFKSKKIEYSNYRVKSKETMEDIAKKFGLKTDSIILCNNLKKKRDLTAGDLLIIPNQDGREIKVLKNDSIYKIANRYGCDWEDIADINNLQSEKLLVGQKLFIPKSGMTKYERDQYYGDYFIWPCNNRYITSPFGPRVDPINGKQSFHSGLDIRGAVGEPVYCSKDGTVINIGVSRVYGNYVEVKHSNNMITKYAHLSKVEVKKGDEVSQGQVIAKIGNTGRSTGPHLHFEIRKNGKLVNPLKIM